MDNIFNIFDLFIFDLDDTLINTEKYHYKAWIKVLKEELDNNFEIDFNNYCLKFHSINKDSIYNYLKNELKINDYQSCINKKNNYYLDIINKDKENIKMIEGSYNFINKIINNNKEFVIVSNTSKINIEFYLELFPILKKSSKFYYKELYKNKKPDPECYYNVVTDFPNRKYIGFEDSVIGVHALTQVSNITPIFINTDKYYYYNYILQNYNIINIKNYNDLERFYIF